MRPLALAMASSFALCTIVGTGARADNAMHYHLVTAQEAASLPHNGGAFGLELQGAEMIQEPGMNFEIMRISRVHPGSAGAHAGLHQGDELISVNGQVFPSLAVFASYVGSMSPGRPVSVDYIPAGGGPAQAQRVQVVPGQGGAAPRAGMSTREKLAIGVGAAALFGCYEMGCFSHHQTAPQPQAGLQPQPMQPSQAFQHPQTTPQPQAVQQPQAMQQPR